MDAIRQYLDESEDEQMVYDNEVCNQVNDEQTNNQINNQANELINSQTNDSIDNQMKGDDLKIGQDDEIVKELVNELISMINVKRVNDKVNGRVIINENEIQISSDESDCDSESNFEVGSEDEENLDKCLTRFKALKTKGELLIEELPAPDYEPVQLTCGIDDLQQIGNVSKILDNILIVESFKNLPALDLDSLLFFRTGRSIGQVFDVIGPVIKPYYVIRFATNQQIVDNSITINMPVYFVPKFNNLTKYVLVSQLKQVRGSDASWENNNEPPENVKEYSDDEEERKDKLKMKAKRRPNFFPKEKMGKQIKSK